MIRPYEVVYIFDSALEDEAINQKLTQFHSLIHSEGAEAPRLNHWGRRTLAKLLPEFERALRLDDAVLRFLVVLNDVPPTPPQAITAKSEFEEEE